MVSDSNTTLALCSLTSVCWISVYKDVLYEFAVCSSFNQEAVISAEMKGLKIYQK